MKMDKKGFGKREIVGSIIVAVLLTFFFPLVLNIGNIAKASSDVELCRLSVISSSIKIAYNVKVWNLELFELGAPNPFSIDCPKRYAYLKEDVIRVDDVSTAYSKNALEKENQVKDFVLGELTKCWKSFGDASDKIYQAQTEDGVDINTDETACFSCSDVFILKEFNEGKPMELHDFYSYANEKTRIIDKESYVEFLTGGTGLSDVPDDKTLVLEPGQQWSTVFTIKEINNEVWGQRYWGDIPAIGGIIKWNANKIKGHLLPKVNSGIVDCYLVAELEHESGEVAERVISYKGSRMGCSDGLKGIVFGKVAGGYDKTKFTPGDLLDLNIPVTNEKSVFPMTVRFVPTEDVFKEGQCKRLY